jgi:hypothetical protein
MEQSPRPVDNGGITQDVLSREEKKKKKPTLLLPA